MRVNPGVGAAGACDCDVMVEEFPQRPLKLTLDGPKLWLNLPAVEVRAVIGKCQLEVTHSIGYSMGLGVRAMPGITATIITLNEEDRIAEALASLACCDEIVVVDSGSTDRTREIALNRGARVFTRAWEGYSPQKNFAADQATHDWILSIDADERLSIALADEIAQWKKVGDADRMARAYSMPRRAFYLGKWIKHSGWYPDRKVRLYHRRHCHWEGTIHEDLKVDGSVERLRGDLLHFPFNDWEDQKSKIDKYTKLAAHDARTRGVRGNIFNLVLGPPAAFIKSFFVRAGFLDGFHGLTIAYTGARYVFLRQLRILRPWK
jgi:glycosyltransferase involved in cell wall biosynthesis